MTNRGNFLIRKVIKWIYKQFHENNYHDTELINLPIISTINLHRSSIGLTQSRIFFMGIASHPSQKIVLTSDLDLHSRCLNLYFESFQTASIEFKSAVYSGCMCGFFRPWCRSTRWCMRWCHDWLKCIRYANNINTGWRDCLDLSCIETPSHWCMAHEEWDNACQSCQNAEAKVQSPWQRVMALVYPFPPPTP